MPAINYVEEQDADEEVKEIYEQIKESLGVDQVPNTFKAMANKPDFLKAMLQLDETVFADDELDSKTKHLIAIAVSATSGCEYCTLAHSAASKMFGASEGEITEALTVASVMGAYNNFNKAIGLENDLTP